MNQATSPTPGAKPPVEADQLALVLKSVPVFPQSLRASIGVAEGIGMGVGDFFDPLTVGATVADGDAEAEGAGLAVGKGDGGFGALSALLALNSRAQKHPRTRRGKIPLFICQSCREERRMTQLLEKCVNEIATFLKIVIHRNPSQKTKELDIGRS